MSRRQAAWSRFTDDELLDLRFCDLGLDLTRCAVYPHVRRLFHEIEDLGIAFRPPCWLSTEWFSPDGIPGIALPFYLAHPRLEKLEKKQMLKVEGAGRDACLRILRHELGHALSTAYRLHRRRRFRELFGSVTLPYPDYYKPRLNSRHYVIHLDYWYAQSHPAEDFAETFAVWMRPGWRRKYEGWPALRKLEYVHELMQEIRATPPPVTSRRRPDSLPTLRTTLREHYRLKKLHYADEWPEFFDQDLLRLFTPDRHTGRTTAAAFLRSIKPQLRQAVAEWTGVHPYTINQVIADMIDRCKELHLRLHQPRSPAVVQAKLMVTVQTMRYLHEGRHRIAM